MRFLLGDLYDEAGTVEVGSVAQLRTALSGQRFDLILIDPDIWAGGMSQAVTELHGLAGETPIVVLSAIDDPRAIRHALGEGAAGYIPKDSAPALMLLALKLVLAGGLYLPPRLLELIPPRDDDGLYPARGTRDPLTERQRAVLAHLAKGAPNKEIARALRLSEGAVKAHIAGLLRMLNARNRTEAIIKAGERGWIAAAPGRGAPSAQEAERH